MLTRDGLPVKLLALPQAKRDDGFSTHQKAAPIWLPCYGTSLVYLKSNPSENATHTLAGLEVNLLQKHMVSIPEFMTCRTGGVPIPLTGRGPLKHRRVRECQHTISRIVKEEEGYKGLKRGRVPKLEEELKVDGETGERPG